MSRTRAIFFAILALYLTVIAVTLAANVVASRFLSGLFIASTIFAAGVVLLDFSGLLGEHHGDTAGDVTAGHIGDDLTGGDGGHIGDVHDVGFDHPDAHDIGHDAADHAAEGQPPVAPHHAVAAPVLSVLTYLRLFVYFCLGFGPVGWIALATGRQPLLSLGLAAGVGVAAVFLAQAFFRFQRHDTDSQLRTAELVGQRAAVIVPLDDKTMGKVRVQVGLSVTEQYALAARAGASFRTGDEVVITSATDECVYVR